MPEVDSDAGPSPSAATVAEMRITLLGTGGPRPDRDRQGPATLVRAGGVDLLVDAGRGVATQLARVGLRPGDLDAVLVTHHHFDHIGGLGDLLMAAWNEGRTAPLPIVGPPGTVRIVDALLDSVYNRDIAYRIAEEAALGTLLDPPRRFLRVRDVVADTWTVGGATVTVGEVEHGQAVLDLPADEWTAVGYRIEADGRAVAIPGDAVDGKDLAMLVADVDVLVMCAYLAPEEVRSPADRFLVEHVLAGSEQAAAIAAAAGAGRLVLTHLREKTPDRVGRMVDAADRVFPGEVVAGSDLLTIEV